jgi:hypothetical protein
MGKTMKSSSIQTEENTFHEGEDTKQDSDVDDYCAKGNEAKLGAPLAKEKGSHWYSASVAWFLKRLAGARDKS